MKKLLILLPVLAVILVAGVAFSKPEPAEKDPYNIEKQVWESFPRSGMRLGLVLSDNATGREPGVRVERVIPDGPADRAGLKAGDVILSLDGKKVHNPGDVREFLKGLDKEKEVQAEIQRDGNPMTVQVTPEVRDGMMHMVFGPRMFLGINLQELDPDLASYFQMTPGAGALVTSVEQGSPAEKAGIRSGDVITHLDGQKVNAPSDIVRKLEDLQEGDSMEITVLRHGSEKKLTAKPEQRGMMHPRIPDLPDVHQMLNSPEFQQNMEEMRHDMEKMRQELQLHKEDLEKLKDEIHKEVQQEMEKVRKELKDRKNET